MLIKNTFNVGRKIHLDVNSDLDKNENINLMVESFKEQWTKITEMPSEDKIREICKVLYYKSIE